LENVVQRAVVLSEGQTVDVAQLPATLRQGRVVPAPTEGREAAPLSRSYEDEVRRFKRSLVVRALRESGWRKAECARNLGVARGYLHRLINLLGIQEGEGASAAQDRDELPLGPVM